MGEQAQFVFLGTGASMGIPVIGCHCSVCLSNNPMNRRLRAAALIKCGGKQLLVDVGPDFRMQALNSRLEVIDGVILTHAHYDHIGGLDDLRPLAYKRDSSMPLLLSRGTWIALCRSSEYLFTDHSSFRFSLYFLEGKRGEFLFEDVLIRYFTYSQMGMEVNGFRLGEMAYLSDIKDYPATIFDDLKGISILIISALRFTPSPMHFTVDEAVAFAEKVGAKQTWITHLAHDLEHVRTEAYLPKTINLAYDGLEFSFGY